MTLRNAFENLATEPKQDDIIAAVGGLLTDTELRASPVGVDDTPAGTWAYHGGANGTVNVTGRVLSIAAIATEDGASVTIDGGDSIPVPTDIGWCITPRRALVDPSVTFTGTASYTIEYVA